MQMAQHYINGTGPGTVLMTILGNRTSTISDWLDKKIQQWVIKYGTGAGNGGALSMVLKE